MGSGSKLHKQQEKDPGNLGERNIMVTHLAGRRGARERHRCACTGSSVLRDFKDGDFREGPRGGSQQNTHQLPRCVLSGSWSPLIGWRQGRGGSLVITAGPEAAMASLVLFCCFSGPGAKTLEAKLSSLGVNA